MTIIPRIEVRKVRGSVAWEYRIKIPGVSDYAVSKLAYLSLGGACGAAIKIGKATNWMVFDFTNRKCKIIFNPHEGIEAEICEQV